TTGTSQGGAQLAMAPGSSVATTASTSEESEAQASGAAAATPGGAAIAALPNGALRKEGGAGEVEGSGEAAGPPARKPQPQTSEPPTAVAEFIAGVAESYEQLRLRARLGALRGSLMHPETPSASAGQELSPQTLAALLARW